MRTDKFLPDIATALREAGVGDGMTLSFHHHLRNGDFVVNMALDALAALGVKDITIALSSVFPVHEPLVRHMQSGLVRALDTNYVSGPVAHAISRGIAAQPVMFRSHGGRPRAIGEGSLKIDIACIAAPCVDGMGNINGCVFCADPTSQSGEKLLAFGELSEQLCRCAAHEPKGGNVLG
jgi:citrate lyase subunit alpha/citrate CoA-transferase